jgi:hypothetical protein
VLYALRYHSPQNHDYRQEDAWPKFLQQDIRQRLKDRVTDEEYRKSLVVLSIGHVEVLLQAIDFCVANIGPVEKRDQIQEGKPWNEFYV